MKNMSRNEMCAMLCNNGHKMQDLEKYSDNDLMKMCEKCKTSTMMESDNMSRTEMCMMLCNMGHKIEELEICSNEELMQMCKDKMNMNDNMMENHSNQNYMFFSNLKAIKRLIDMMLELDESHVDMILTNGHAWAVDHISTSKDDIEEVYGFLMDRDNHKKMEDNVQMEEKLSIIKSWKNFK
jgi:hypothetical protein